VNPPAFAIIGHPNEGKSSVVSTLTEDETVAVSPVPGETTACRAHAIRMGGKTLLQFIDTPGFQNPAAVLEAFQAHTGPEENIVPDFIRTHAKEPRFHHDCELLKPLADRAGILYVADASRPLRESDRQEMEILRLTGLPRMALLNCKRQETRHLDTWKDAIGRRFNIQREFNAHHATTSERLQLLDALRILNPDWNAPLLEVIQALKTEHQRRQEESLLILEALLIDTARHVSRITLRSGDDPRELTGKALETYRNDLRSLEARARRQWRDLHHLSRLPGGEEETPLITGDLFAEHVWKLLGLTRRQLATLGAVSGGLLGLGADAATGGLSMGILTAGGAVLGAVSGWMGSPGLGAKRLPLPGRRTLAREQLQVGPLKDIALLSILIDRSLLYLLRLGNWAHARRDHDAFLQSLKQQEGFVAAWPEPERKALLSLLVSKRSPNHPPTLPASIHQRLRETLGDPSLTNRQEFHN
jgi:hypothetical protein